MELTIMSTILLPETTELYVPSDIKSGKGIYDSVEAEPQVYVPSDIKSDGAKAKRFRRTKNAVKSISDAIVDLLENDHPQTVRQVFYALTVRGIINKHETEYQRTVIRLLVDLRERGIVPFEYLADNTRWQRKPTAFTGIANALENCAQAYRRDLWAASPVYVEVWCEKDAVAGVLYEETKVYDVPLMVARGYSSLTFLHSAAEAIQANDKPAHIFHFGDLDPSGQDAARDIEAKLRRYAPDAEIHFTRVGVTRQQADDWDLPTRPTKQTDTRAKKFNGTSVELDAIPAAQLRTLVRESIEKHIDKRQLEILRAAEKSERELLLQWGKTYGGGQS
jgi:hypothetical protein